MIKRFFPWLIVGIVMLVSWQISQTRSLSMHFVDEEDHIAFADYINQDYKLHRDIQNNHQPLIYFGSALIQKITRPDNIFMLIRRHRQAVFLYGLLWSLLIVWRFKDLGVILVLFFEFLKYWLLGNLWLMETLAVYPAVYVFGNLLQVWFEKYKLKVVESIFLGICAFIIIFTIVPLWPWLALVYLLFLIKQKKMILWHGLGLLIGMVILFSSNYSPVDWFRESIYNNWLYAIPALSPYQGPLDWLKMIGFPFLAFFTTNSLQANFIALFFSGYLLAVFKNRKLLLLYPWLILANNRVLSPGTVYYQGFHLLPWLGIMIFTFGFSLKLIKYKDWWVFAVVSIVLLSNKSMPYFLKTDTANEYYINYSTVEDMNFAVKNISQPTDRLAVLDNQPLIYWQTKTKPATRQLVYYGWETQVKDLRENYNRVFYGDNPPEIIYGGKEANLMAEKYINLQRDNQATLLFIRKDRYEKITPEQWAALETRRFNR
ncbi:MAG: hypothetical protein V1810_05195 [Candidatus Beckwithbacteria bacterium]